MKTKKLKSLSIASLILSIIPLTTLIPVFLKATLAQGVNTAWTCINIICAVSGLILSVFCVQNKESRNAINIISTVISGFLTLLILGIVAIAFLLNFIQR